MSHPNGNNQPAHIGNDIGNGHDLTATIIEQGSTDTRSVAIVAASKNLSKRDAVRYINLNKMFPCPQCGKRIRGSNMERHIRTHDITRLYTEHDDDILRMYEAYFSIAAIGEFLGISKHHVRRALIAHGVTRRAPQDYDGTRLDYDILVRTYFLYKKGLTYREVAKIMGVRPSTVKSRLHKGGFQRRTRAENDALLVRRRRLRRLPKEEVQRTIDLRKSGLSYDAIGEIIGLSGSAVGSRLRRAGYPESV